MIVNNLAIPCNWGIGPRNLSLFARPLVTGRLMQVGHETNAQYVNTFHMLLLCQAYDDMMCNSS